MLQQLDVGLGLVASFFWHWLQSPVPVSISLQAWSLLKFPPTFFEYHQVDFSVIFYLRFWSWALSNERMIGFLFSLRSVSFLLTVCSPSVSFASHFKFSWQLYTKFSWYLSPSRCWHHYIPMVLFFGVFLSGEYGAHIPLVILVPMYCMLVWLAM